MKKNIRDMTLTDQQLERELQRTVQKRYRWSKFKKIWSFLIVMVATVVVITNFWFPIHYVTEDTSGTNRSHGLLIAAMKTDTYKSGDVVLVRKDGDVFMRRLVGIPGDSLDIDPDGNLSVNGLTYHEEQLGETIMQVSAFEYPYEVPQGACLVVADIRTKTIETIDKENIVGSHIICLWPVQQAGFIR